MPDYDSDKSEGVKRISISLPPSVFHELDQLVAKRGFENRSQAISEMIHQSATEHFQERGNRLMAGTITLFYDESKPGLLQALAEIAREHIDEVISSQNVLLEDHHTMVVMLVQGPASRLKTIADKLITCKGVRSGKLTISSAILPPIHMRKGPGHAPLRGSEPNACRGSIRAPGMGRGKMGRGSARPSSSMASMQCAGRQEACTAPPSPHCISNKSTY